MKNEDFARNPEMATQGQVRSWWEQRPMTYDWETVQSPEEGTFEFFKRADEIFWKISESFAHPDWPQSKPFSKLIDYPQLKGQRVLEVGCGIGALAEQLARAARSFAAVDLTEYGLEDAKCYLAVWSRALINTRALTQLDTIRM